ncbi:hypothetical protein G7062_03220 [Erysipelothrix sp. HDW6C]|uniref:hypothetical protein n=1 Tax=Erysipelothrix sp. HDW6C TaxID=2714930 RepID=UPI00140773E9|nr:hypothetical protein [Erysipelothrix sp. HDW6C]QIK69365.1 hypothetical protein G7062_03220 [Erysipelothrix sp. HDW6C]
MKNNKKRTGVLVGLLAGALLVTGTLAWQDVSQHKTNKFTTTSVEHNVTLVETFEEVSNWRKGEAKVNQISVRNGQDTDDIASYIYEDAYVRVQLKEFMEIKNKSYTYSEKRYMVDEKGNFKRFATLELAQEFMATLGEEAPVDGRIEEVTGLFDKDEEGNVKGFFYIATQQADKNGQYGKFIVMTEVLGEGDVLVEGSINQNHSSDDQHNNAIVDEETGSIDYNVDEDQYTTHLWGAGDNMSADGNPFTQYVKWTFGTDVITMAEWDGQPTAQWIVDTDSTEGYAYWGEKLVHGTDATATPKSITNNILEKVTLIEQPYGAAEYYIHVNMDAVNLKDVSLWADAPAKFTNAISGKDPISMAYKELAETIATTKTLDFKVIPADASSTLVTAIASAQSVHDTDNATLAVLKEATKELQLAVEAYNTNELVVAKRQLLQLLNEAEEIDTNGKSEELITALSIAHDNGEMCFNDGAAEVAHVTEAITDLTDALAAIKS